ncbi:hypothetical protein GCM10009635_13720 [Actinocatenispora thailandica]
MGSRIERRAGAGPTGTQNGTGSPIRARRDAIPVIMTTTYPTARGARQERWPGAPGSRQRCGGTGIRWPSSWDSVSTARESVQASGATEAG